MYIIENEIMQQHISLKKTFEYLNGKKTDISKMFEDNNFKQILFMGCGSSFMLAQAGAAMFSLKTDIKTYAVAGGDFLISPQEYAGLLKDSLVVLITRSGKTSEIDYAIDAITSISGAYTLCIHAQSNTVIPQKSNFEIGVDWAFDNAVCQTRTITNFYTILAYLLAVYSKDLSLEKSIESAINNNEEFKNKYRPMLESVVEKDWNKVVVLGDGELSGLLSEGALAFNEICITPAIHFNILDFRHGPAVLIDDQTLMIIVLRDNKIEMQYDFIADMKGRGATVLAISKEEKVPQADYSVTVDSSIEEYAAWGIPCIYIPQMISFAKAKQTGVNPDSPEGLDPYILL